MEKFSLKQSLILVLIAVMALFVFGCFGDDNDNDDPIKNKITGIVKDASTTQGLNGASLTLSKDNQVVATTTSDANGEFEFEVATGTYSLKVTKTGYQDKIETGIFVSDTKGEDVYVEVELVEKQIQNKITGVVKDAITYENLSNANLILSQNDETVAATTSDVNGEFEFEVDAGTYSLKVSKSGYHDMSADEVFVSDIEGKDVYVALVPVDETITNPISAVTGVVVDANGNPVANATISASADDPTLTNGYFVSSESNANGQFFISAIPLISSVNSELIPSFKVRCIKGGYITEVVSGIVLEQNKVKIVNFELDTGTAGNVVYQENFESQTNWQATGFWQRHDNTTIYNQAYPMYVKLAPNDNTNGAIPNSYEGTHSYWYGEDSTGNFLGTLDQWQEELSGGTSTTSNMGILTSPIIDLTNVSTPTLTFWTWYEIESVNPNSMGFDIMEIAAIDVDTDERFPLGRLNPYVDPILEDREAIPFTSSGFNKAPTWIYVEYDLSVVANKEIRLEFSFDTVDELYNGFRGWLVDNIKIMSDMATAPNNVPFRETKGEPRRN